MSLKYSKVIIGCLLGGLIGALGYFYWFSASKVNIMAEQGRALSTAVAGAGSAREQADAIATLRAQSSTQITSSPHVAVKQVTFSKSELEAHPKFWMLGYSEQDVAWLARFGYPTLEEENKLTQTNDQQLRALAEMGNLNAQVHLSLRLVLPAFMSNDAKSLRQAAYMIQQSLIEGGPYQAAKTAEFFVNLAKNRRSLGGLNEGQRAALQEELLPLYEMSKGISAMYGDFAAVRAVNEYRDVGIMFGLPASQPTQFEFAMARLANMNKSRMQRRLEPYEMIQRPSPPGPPDILSFQGTNTVFVR